MKKIILLCMIVSGAAFGAAQSSAHVKSVAKSTCEEVSYIPGNVIITAIINAAHNTQSVMKAQGYDDTEENLSMLHCTIPAGKSTADAEVCAQKLHVALPYKRDVHGEDLQQFHIATGHGTYTFANTLSGLIAYRLNKKCLKVKSQKMLLLPWPEERRVELIIGHDGKLEMRLPGSLAKSIRSERSKSVKK